MHNIPDFLRLPSEMQEHFAKGGMIKRADGSYSRRGLWDNIRANKGSGRKPTKQMLEQEAKIRAKEQYGGRVVDEYGNGGYTVRRSHDRKGKTHVVIGPDGTKKYFGDPNMGERGKSKHGKEAFYARHAKNLKNNPYFRAYARATWEDGGEVPESDIFNNWKKQNNFNPFQWWQDQIMKDPSRNISTGPEIGPVLSNYDDPFHSWNIPSRGSVESMTPPTFSDGGSYGPFYGRRDAAKMQRMFTPSADSMTPSFFAVGGPFKNFEEEPTTGNSGQGINTTTPQQSPAVASVPQNGQPFGMMAQSPAPQAPSPLTSQSLTNYLESNTPEASASRQNTEDYNYQQAMQKDFGKSMDEVDMAYKDLATAHPNYTNQELLKTLRTNYQDELNKKNTDLKNQSMKAEQARMKSIAGTLHGVDKMGQATMAGLDLFSRMNPNSYQNAVLNKNRENANPMNTMNIVGNRKGIEYSAYGGYTGLKEGVELNLSTQQIHELEKQGYKFQIL